jgi:Zn finger protein HypA/HybF involved in hydrogenase expression
MASTKKYNLVILRKKFCSQCKQSFNVYNGQVICPYCGSHKIHYKNGRGS